ncbi:MAG: tetratricopeptide repeat protein [Sulfurovaceae bacterium]|nr:tetratricopeptide repeat protein [Sulfurovaceae bacterium]
MKKIVRIFLFLSVVTYAGFLDFLDRHNAWIAYKNKEYHKSTSILYSLDKTQQDWYNLGNSYYKEGKYKEAINAYEKAQNSVNKYYNIGNSYFKLEDFDSSIKSYEQALKVQKDQDAQHNLELAKIQQKKSRQKQDQKSKQAEKRLQNNKQDNIQQNKLKYMLEELKNKKIPTIMYVINPTQRNQNDAKPW